MKEIRPNWRPLNTAPRDATVITVWCNSGIYNTYWGLSWAQTKGSDHWVGLTGGIRPTHWIPTKEFNKLKQMDLNILGPEE
jgi:hypothetical protein